MTVCKKLSCAINDAWMKVLNSKAPHGGDARLRGFAPHKLYITKPTESIYLRFKYLDFTYAPTLNASPGILDLNNVSFKDRSIHRDETHFRLDMRLDRKTLFLGSTLCLNHLNGFMTKCSENWRLIGHRFSFPPCHSENQVGCSSLSQQSSYSYYWVSTTHAVLV